MKIEDVSLEWRIADVSDRLLSLSPALDMEWKRTCREAVLLLREMASARRHDRAALEDCVSVLHRSLLFQGYAETGPMAEPFANAAVDRGITALQGRGASNGRS